MTKHIEVKHKVKQIKTKTSFYELIDDIMLSEVEREMMIMYYVDNKDLSYIADTLGYSKQGISKMHKRILKKLEGII